MVNGRGCKKCGYKRVSKALKFSNAEFISKLNKVHPEIEPLEEYAGSNTKIKFKCKACGNVWGAKPHNVLGKDKIGCPKCGIKKLSNLFSKTNDQFVKDLKERTKCIIPLENYVNNKTKIKFKCKRCNYEWYATPNSILKNTSCPSCSKSGTSYVEQYILLMLRKIFGVENVLSRKKNIINRELDIYLPSYNFAIEYGSWYWHKDRLKEDVEKYKLCIKKGIELLRIYDCCKDDIKDTRDIWYYNTYLGDKIEYLIALVKRILDMLRVNYDECKLKKLSTTIPRLAQQKSFKMSEQEFLDIVRNLNSNIDIIGPFLGRKSKIKCRCKKCNNTWESTPQSLLSGKGCKLCGYKKTAEKITKNHVWFLENFNKKNKSSKNIIFLTKYKKSTEKIKCKCLKCNNVWYTTPICCYKIMGALNAQILLNAQKVF